MMTMSRKNLIEAGRNLSFPFVIKLPHHDPILCEKPLRILPNKRLTLQGKWQEKHVVIKVFLDKFSSKRHAMRDKAGIEALHRYKFNAPEILYVGKNLQNDVDIVIYEYILSALKIKQCWESSTQMDEQIDLISKMTQTLARQHALGLMQKDLHLNNFLLKRGRIYCLDGDGIVFSKTTKPLSIRASFKNLAMFLQNLTHYQTPHLRSAFIEYCACRNISADDKHYERLYREMKSLRSHQIKKQMEKTLRDCSSFVAVKKWGQYCVYVRAYDKEPVRQLLRYPERAFLNPENTLLKSGRTSTLALVPCQDVSLVVKRYNVKNITHIIKRVFSRNRARNSWLSAHYLRLLSIDTIKPVGLYEEKYGFIHLRTYFIAEYQTGKFINEFLLEEYDAQYMQFIADKLIQQLHIMKEKQITHGDLKGTNILVSGSAVIFLDLDAITLHRSEYRFKRAFRKDLEIFLNNFKENSLTYNFWKKRFDEEFLS
jgi:tRNA A-37 threonylcarbamoyl transferase component Bud32